MSFANSSAIVLGGVGGIGKEISLQLIRHGLKVSWQVDILKLYFLLYFLNCTESCHNRYNKRSTCKDFVGVRNWISAHKIYLQAMFGDGRIGIEKMYERNQKRIGMGWYYRKQCWDSRWIELERNHRH